MYQTVLCISICYSIVLVNTYLITYNSNLSVILKTAKFPQKEEDLFYRENHKKYIIFFFLLIFGIQQFTLY